MKAPTKSKMSDQRPDAPSFQMPSTAQVLAASEAMLMLYPEARITRIGPEGVTFAHSQAQPALRRRFSREQWDQMWANFPARPDSLKSDATPSSGDAEKWDPFEDDEAVAKDHARAHLDALLLKAGFSPTANNERHRLETQCEPQTEIRIEFRRGRLLISDRASESFRSWREYKISPLGQDDPGTDHLEGATFAIVARNTV